MHYAGADLPAAIATLRVGGLIPVVYTASREQVRAVRFLGCHAAHHPAGERSSLSSNLSPATRDVGLVAALRDDLDLANVVKECEPERAHLTRYQGSPV